MASEINHIISRVNIGNHKRYEKLYDVQIEAISAAARQDTLCVIPTGGGKSRILEAMPYVTEEHKIAVVILPLNAIQYELAESFGQSCLVIDGPKAISDISPERLATVRYCMGHPEHITSDYAKKFFMRPGVEHKISHICIDEAHVCLSWGQGKKEEKEEKEKKKEKKEEAFRPSFACISDMRSIIPKAKMLAVTATATKPSQAKLIESLKMKNVKKIVRSPDRTNILLRVKERPSSMGHCDSALDSYEKIAAPIFNKLAKDPSVFEKTIIYCPLEWCGTLHRLAEEKYGCPIGSVGQFHAPQTDTKKAYLSREMQKKVSEVKILLCTDAYGMGANPDGVLHVHHLCPPSSLETYMQQIGRCARFRDETGQPRQGTATLYHNASDRANCNMTEDMVGFINAKGCRRRYLLEKFGFEPEPLDSCCDICEAKKSSTEEAMEVEVHPFAMAEELSASLSYYFELENDVANIFTGLSQQLINTILVNPTKYAHPQNLKETCPFLRDLYVENICELVNAHL